MIDRTGMTLTVFDGELLLHAAMCTALASCGFGLEKALDVLSSDNWEEELTEILKANNVFSREGAMKYGATVAAMIREYVETIDVPAGHLDESSKFIAHAVLHHTRINPGGSEMRNEKT